ncbi:hypothetical protein MVEN_01168900 [Mycena venus]|uniref:Uncharacterized protein n=1 Tax=Mycena venus TaxID=2733690 RepID=A0A8H7CXR2_9AGAR|nr:hypothetical protein MVEN_01168900 [Mycena venus]
MPRQHSVTEIRINSIVACLTPFLVVLNDLHDAFGSPFILPVTNATASLITGFQNVKRNKDECIQLMESIHQVLYSIINLHLKSETAGFLPPALLLEVGKFTETLYQIHTFIEAQRDTNKIKQLFHKSEIKTMLKGCRTGLDHAITVFKVHLHHTILYIESIDLG